MSQYPNYFAGQRLTAALLTSGETNTVDKTAAQSVTSSAVHVDDSELVISGPAGKFRLEFDYLYTALAAASGGISIGFAVTGTYVTGDMGALGPNSNVSDANDNATGRFRSSALTALISPLGLAFAGSATAGVGGHAKFFGPAILFSTAWTIQTRWSQRTSNATSTIMRVGSSMQATQIG